MSITLNGTIPSGRTPLVILEANGESGTGGPVKFKFSAPQAGAYTMNFCIGPAANPCGSANVYVVTVPGGEERLALVEASIFRQNVLVVSQGTNEELPFAVTIE